MLERVRRWFYSLPEYERDLPLIIHNGVAYTPRMVLEIVERGGPLADALQLKVETGTLGTTEEEVENLARIRLIEILRRFPPDKPIVATLGLPPRVYTAGELIKMISAGDPRVRPLIEAEKRRMIELAGRGRLV